jgi:hypothetical protein
VDHISFGDDVATVGGFLNPSADALLLLTTETELELPFVRVGRRVREN